MTQKKTDRMTAEAFARLGNEKQLQEYSEIIFKLTGLIIDFITSEHETLRISHGENFSPYCKMLRSCREGREACFQCDVANALRAAEEKREICYTCYAGLHEIVVPVHDAGGVYLGCMTSGQFHLSETPLLKKSEVLALAGRFGLDGEKLYRAYRKSSSLTPVQAEGMLSYLNLIARQLVSVRDHLIFMDKINVHDKIEAVKKYLDENYASPLSIKEVAQRFHISPGYLAHRFRKSLNISFQQYVNFRRITEAQQMLTDTEITVSEIAYGSGFGSVSQFNRTFRAIAGMAPKEYRMKHRIS